MAENTLRQRAVKVRKQLADGDAIKPKDLADLARAAKDLASALRINVDMITKAREQAAREAREEAAEVVDHAAKEHGLSAQTVAAIKANILGVSVPK